MFFLTLLFVWFLGYSFISLLGKDFNISLKLGLSLLIGLGFISLFTFIFELINLPISLYNLLGVALVISILFFLKGSSRFKTDIERLRSIQVGIGQINFIWLFFFIIICYFTYGIAKKGIYWPVTEYDSVAGYDYMAKMIAKERVLRVSLFDYSTDANIVARFIYPPLVASSLSLQHMCGPDTIKLIPVLFFIALLFSFYGSLLYFTTHTAAIIATAFMALTPEMFSHASLALTNLPNAAYASMALITFFIWSQKRTLEWLVLSATLMALTLFSRSDSIVFSAAIGIWLLYDSIKSKNFKPLIIYSIVSNALFVSWTLYTKLYLKSNSTDFFVKEIFWDGEKLDSILTYVGDFIVWDTQLYGIGFWLFYLLILLNIKRLSKDLSVFLFISVLSWLLYTFLYYQMNYVVASLDMFMKASYKRGMFCFIPLIWFYIICNKGAVTVFKNLDNIMYK